MPASCSNTPTRAASPYCRTLLARSSGPLSREGLRGRPGAGGVLIDWPAAFVADRCCGHHVLPATSEPAEAAVHVAHREVIDRLVIEVMNGGRLEVIDDLYTAGLAATAR